MAGRLARTRSQTRAMVPALRAEPREALRPRSGGRRGEPRGAAGRARRPARAERRREVDARQDRVRADLAAGVLLIATLGLLGSVFLSATANGIAIFTVFGA